MRILQTFIVIFSLIICSGFALARSDIKVGDKYETSVRIKHDSGDRDIVPLPPGVWEVLHTRIWRNNNNNVIFGIFLIQTVDKVLSNIVWIRFNREMAQYGWVADRTCDRDNLHHAKVYENINQGNVDCYVVNHRRVTLQGSKWGWVNKMGEKLISRGISWGNHHLSTMVRFNDGSDYLKIYYEINPATYGFENFPRTSWNGSPWHPDAIDGFPRRKQFVKAFKDWAKRAHRKARLGWKNDETASTGLPAFVSRAVNRPTKAVNPTNGHEELLKKIKSLLEAGVLTEEEAAAKRKAVLDKMN